MTLRGKQGTDGAFFQASFSPDGKYIVAASEDKNVWVWNLDANRFDQPILLKGHRSKVLDANFSPDSKQIVSLSYDGTVRIWNLQQQPFKTQISNKSGSHILSPKGDLFAIYAPDELTDNYKFEVGSLNGEKPKILQATWMNEQGLWTARSLKDIRFSPDGKRILASGQVSDRDRTWVWDLQAEEPTEIGVYDGNSGYFSPDGQYLITTLEAGNAKLWNLKSKKSVSLDGKFGSFNSAEFSSNGERIATYSYRNSAISVWDLNGVRVRSLSQNGNATEKIAFSPNGEYMAIVSNGYSRKNGYREERNVKIWNLKNDQLLTLKGHGREVTSAAFSPDGQYVVTTSWDTTARLWNLSGQEFVTFQGHEGMVNKASFSPDGKQIVTAGYDKTVRVWNFEGLELAKFETGSINSDAIFSSDGKSIIVDSNSIQVWKLESLQDLLMRGCSQLRYYFLTKSDDKPKFCN